MDSSGGFFMLHISEDLVDLVHMILKRFSIPSFPVFRFILYDQVYEIGSELCQKVYDLDMDFGACELGFNPVFE